MKHGKKYNESVKLVDDSSTHSVIVDVKQKEVFVLSIFTSRHFF